MFVVWRVNLCGESQSIEAVGRRLKQPDGGRAGGGSGGGGVLFKVLMRL